jgi:hypothetical protein
VKTALVAGATGVIDDSAVAHFAAAKDWLAIWTEACGLLVEASLGPQQGEQGGSPREDSADPLSAA